MADYVIDTNVLCCASAADSTSPFDDCNHVSVSDRLTVLDWLSAFHADPAKTLVLDEGGKILKEYGILTEQDFGLLVIRDKLGTALHVPVEYDADGHGVVPDELGSLDKSDRKLAAAALAATILGDEGRCTIVNAVDTDWYGLEEALGERGVVVEQLLPSWCLAKYTSKQKKRPGK